MLYYVLENDYTPDIVCDICPFQIKKMFFTLVRSQDLKEINTDLPIIKKHHDDKK